MYSQERNLFRDGNIFVSHTYLFGKINNGRGHSAQTPVQPSFFGWPAGIDHNAQLLLVLSRCCWKCYWSAGVGVAGAGGGGCFGQLPPVLSTMPAPTLDGMHDRRPLVRAPLVCTQRPARSVLQLSPFTRFHPATDCQHSDTHTYKNTHTTHTQSDQTAAASIVTAFVSSRVLWPRLPYSMRQFA